PFDTPAHLAVSRIDGDEERLCLCVADEHQRVPADYRRCSHSIKIVERPEREPPALFAVAREGDDAQIGEECIDVVAISDWRRRCGIVLPVDRSRARAHDVAAPLDAAVRTVDREYAELLAFGSSEI